MILMLLTILLMGSQGEIDLLKRVDQINVQGDGIQGGSQIIFGGMTKDQINSLITFIIIIVIVINLSFIYIMKRVYMANHSNTLEIQSPQTQIEIEKESYEKIKRLKEKYAQIGK